MSTQTIISGSTSPTATAWEAYGKTGIHVWVDTSAAGFRFTPLYFVSIGGKAGHWAVTGSNAVYNANKKGFRVYLRWPHGGLLTPEYAKDQEWHINWFGIESKVVSEPGGDGGWVPPWSPGENPVEMPKA
jgi:hypothetical protein